MILILLSFLWVGNAFGMNSADESTKLAQVCNAEIHCLENDYRVFVPYVIQVLQRSISPDCTPINILHYLISPEAEINKVCPHAYRMPSDYLASILQKQKLKIVGWYTQQLETNNYDYQKVGSEFIEFFQKRVIPKGLVDEKASIIKKRLPELNRLMADGKP